MTGVQTCALPIFLAIMVMAGVAAAQDKPIASFFETLPDIRTGVAYDMTTSSGGDLLSITVVDIIKWGKGKFGLTEDKLCLGAGLITQISNNDNIDPCVSLSYHLGGLEFLGFSYPLKNLVDIEVGAFAGRDFDAENWKAGIQATILRF